MTRTFRDGHAGTWWAADARLGWWGPDGARRLVAVTADPGTLPDKATWYLVTNLPRPGGPREADSDHPAASLAEIVRLSGIRHWVEQGYKQVKDELGWADFQVRFGELAPDRLVWPYALGRDTSVVRKRASMVAMSSCGTGVSAGVPGWSPPLLALNAMLRTVW